MTRLQPRGAAFGFPPMWVVYHKPRDLPQYNFVVRLWYGELQTTEFEGFDTIEAVRARLLEIGVSAKIARMPGDDPVIYEVWL